MVDKMKISNELLIQYYKSLINNYFKILPLFEGRDLQTKQIIYTQEQAYEMFQKYIQNFIIEVCGSNELFIVNVNSIKLLSLLRGMQEIQIGEHKKTKSVVMSCIDLCNKVIKELEGV